MVPNAIQILKEKTNEEGNTVNLGFESLPGARTYLQGTGKFIDLVWKKFGTELTNLAIQVAEEG